MSSSIEDFCTTPEFLELADTTTNNIPQNSKKKYKKAYEIFMEWHRLNNVSSFSESVLTAYFSQLGEKYKSSTLWSLYSMLRSMLIINHSVNIEKYDKLRTFLKRKSDGYCPKKAKTLTKEEVDSFIREAPDDKHLATKVSLIMGIMGACRSPELYAMNVEDLRDLGSAYVVTVKKPNTNVTRKFTVTDSYYDLCKKYATSRPKNANYSSYFLNYSRGKCSNQRIGINKLCQMGKEIAKFLNLPDPEKYTGHCFRRSSATVVADTSTLERHGPGESTSEADDSLPQNIKTEETPMEEAGDVYYILENVDAFERMDVGENVTEVENVVKEEYMLERDEEKTTVKNKTLVHSYMDIAKELFEKFYENLAANEQNTIIDAGRPKPDMSDLVYAQKTTKSGEKIIPTVFDPKLYDEYDWLCGSENMKKLFCFPCLIFLKENTLQPNEWINQNVGGTPTPENMQEHERSAQHILSAFRFQMIDFQRYGSGNFEDNANKIQHKLMIERKTAALVKHINQICLSVIKDSPEYTTDLSLDSLHDDLRIEVVQAITDRMIQHIKTEISASQYVAIMLDDVTDALKKPKLSVSFRYIHEGEIFERFIKFIDKKDAIEMKREVFDLLGEFACKEKLIGQTYDGATIIPSKTVQDMIREELSSAVFYNCHSLSVNTVVSKAISKIKNCRLFFASCNAFITFFNYTSKHNPALRKLVQTHVPKSIQEDTIIKSMIVNIVYDNLSELRNLLSLILEQHDQWDSQVILEIMGLRNQLINFEFIFLLQMFIGIHTETNKLFISLKSQRYAKSACEEQLQQFNIKIVEMRDNEFEILYAKTADLVDPNFDLVKLGADNGRYKELHHTVYDEAKKIINFRINTVTNSNFFDLLNSSDFEKFNKKFPLPIFQDFIQLYPNQINPDELEVELQILYTSKIFQGKSINEIYDLLELNKFKKSLKMLYRLVNLMLTIPTTSVPKKIPYMLRIEDYCRRQSRLSTTQDFGIELLDIEWNLLKMMKMESFFYSVLECLAKKNKEWYKML